MNLQEEVKKARRARECGQRRLSHGGRGELGHHVQRWPRGGNHTVRWWDCEEDDDQRNFHIPEQCWQREDITRRIWLGGNKDRVTCTDEIECCCASSADSELNRRGNQVDSRGTHFRVHRWRNHRCSFPTTTNLWQSCSRSSVEGSWNPQRRTGPIWVMKMRRTSLKSWRLSSLLEATPSTSRSYERLEGDKDCRRCYPSRPKPTTRVFDRRGVFGCTCQYRLISAAAVQQCSR